jgi:hypothetical protein
VEGEAIDEHEPSNFLVQILTQKSKNETQNGHHEEEEPNDLKWFPSNSVDQ